MTDDWNPNDPGAARVHYDLANWSFEQMAELAAAWPTPRSAAWDGNELIVPEGAEAETDDIVAQVEVRLVRLTTKSSRPKPSRWPTARRRPSTTWPSGSRVSAISSPLTSSLALPFRWEEDVLLVSTDDEELVDSILDDVENDEGVDLPDDTVDDDSDADRLPFETLTTFFLAGDRLQKNPLDADGLEQLLSATDVADPDRPPYGVDKRLWVRMCELDLGRTRVVATAPEPDVVETQAVAAELHDLLRPYV